MTMIRQRRLDHEAYPPVMPDEKPSGLLRIVVCAFALAGILVAFLILRS